MTADERMTIRDNADCWCVYRVLSDLCSEAYVGMTGNLKRRWNEHRGAAKRGDDKLLYEAMRRVGIDTFRIEKLVDCPDRDTALKAERHWIGHLGTIDPFGLNAIGDDIEPGAPGAADWRWRDSYARTWDGFRTEATWRYGIEFRAAPGSRAKKQGKLWFSRAGLRLD
jgi:predicted GIY-YIG superfamily endonuclease